MAAIGRRPLGASGIHVSELALGSWRTYERIPRDAGLAVMRKARELGINFLDDARYNDETGTAPMKSGYSEVVFGELFRATGWTRDEVVLANKLWWEFWPEQRAAAELDASLERMGMAYIDLAYAESPPAGLTMQEIVHDIGALISAGKLRAWGVLNWKPDQMVEAAKEAGAQGVPPPCAAQLAYSLVRRRRSRTMRWRMRWTQRTLVSWPRSPSMEARSQASTWSPERQGVWPRGWVTSFISRR